MLQEGTQVEISLSPGGFCFAFPIIYFLKDNIQLRIIISLPFNHPISCVKLDVVCKEAPGGLIYLRQTCTLLAMDDDPQLIAWDDVAGAVKEATF